MIEPKYLKNLQVALEVKQFMRRTKGTCNHGTARYHTFLRGGQDLDTAVVSETPSQDVADDVDTRGMTAMRTVENG
jgi:FixJ family two-component response regulator